MLVVDFIREVSFSMTVGIAPTTAVAVSEATPCAFVVAVAVLSSLFGCTGSSEKKRFTPCGDSTSIFRYIDLESGLLGVLDLLGVIGPLRDACELLPLPLPAVLAHSR